MTAEPTEREQVAKAIAEARYDIKWEYLSYAMRTSCLEIAAHIMQSDVWLNRHAPAPSESVDVAAIGESERAPEGELVHLTWEDANELHAELTQDGCEASTEAAERFYDAITQASAIKRAALAAAATKEGQT